MADQITLKEALELVEFEPCPEGWRVKNVRGDVHGDVLGSARGSIWGDLIDKWVQEAFRKKPYGCKHPTHTYVACKAFEHGRNHAARAALTQPEPEGLTVMDPRGCPTPGACSCPTSPTVPPELIRALELAESALADIGDAEREPGDDLAWAEARAAQDLPRLRSILARCGRPAVEPDPEGPTDEELNTMLYYEFTTSTGHGERSDPIGFARAVLARWGRPAIKPVLVSERLPGEGDCDPSSQCWWFTPSEEKWILWPIKWAGPECSHWLPHHALPLPTTTTETP